MTPPLRIRAGALLISVATWLAVRGLRLVGAPMLVVRTPEYAREQDAAADHVRELLGKAREAQRTCPCERCKAARANAAARAN